MGPLNGQVAVITGAASGIGLATARLLGRQGMKVVLADVDDNRLESIAAGCKDEGLEATAVPTDVAQFGQMQRLADVAYETYGAVNVLFLNAGISRMADFFDDEVENWERLIDVNLKGVVWGIKAFVSRMIAGGQDGVVLATSSGAGAEGTSAMSGAYAATKIAVMSVMESLYGQLRDQESRLRTGIVLPPMTATGIAGGVEIMKAAEQMMQARGVPAVLVEPETVAELILDGIRRDRFFIRVGPHENDTIFDGAHPAAFFEWNERMIRGRAIAQLGDGSPDPYLW